MTCSTSTIQQTPQELLDYIIDWATRGLGTDTINGSSYTQSSSDFTLSNKSIGSPPTTTTFWITGGVAGEYYTITNTVTTAGGRTLQETVIYQCIAQRLI